ncbi:hypothetical protein H6P81_013627 [Aristolochia fimbriata]|uniref:Uncharacterized protein n=1 Tax=Aristolochia fimbriata TaxID=158543 RepID=A0AAV7EFM4_ARIFI|nr:hypothetical protein H6P81_013627 [Aristolochia fimbriata]
MEQICVGEWGIGSGKGLFPGVYCASSVATGKELGPIELGSAIHLRLRCCRLGIRKRHTALQTGNSGSPRAGAPLKARSPACPYALVSF